MITYKFTVGVGLRKSVIEDEITVESLGYTDDEWNDLDEDEKEIELEDAWRDWSSNHIDGGWSLIWNR